jgi:hypothetical protein
MRLLDRLEGVGADQHDLDLRTVAVLVLAKAVLGGGGPPSLP